MLSPNSWGLSWYHSYVQVVQSRSNFLAIFRVLSEGLLRILDGRWLLYMSFPRPELLAAMPRA